MQHLQQPMCLRQVSIQEDNIIGFILRGDFGVFKGSQFWSTIVTQTCRAESDDCYNLPVFKGINTETWKSKVNCVKLPDQRGAMEGGSLKQVANSHRKDFQKQALLLFLTFNAKLKWMAV